MSTQVKPNHNINSYAVLADEIKCWGKELGFDYIGITDIDLRKHQQHLDDWLSKGWHGEMAYMQKHGSKRSHPEQILPGTIRVISARLDYSPKNMKQAENVLNQSDIGYISRYALGRDYHKVMRKKLKKLGDKISESAQKLNFRVFTDSAPVLEKALAEKSGLGWIGKHTNLIDSKTGSWFFIGEIYVNIPLPIDLPSRNHCGTCQQCIDVCPTQAIIAPYQLDARRCISYLTIELKSHIPNEFREKIGNRIYGCDDCQLFCPWNKFAKPSSEDDFLPREQLTDKKLIELFLWSEQQFLRHTEGTAIRRIGYDLWLRNISVALGNALASEKIIDVLKSKLTIVPPMVREHIEWAIEQQTLKLKQQH